MGIDQLDDGSAFRAQADERWWSYTSLLLALYLQVFLVLVFCVWRTKRYFSTPLCEFARACVGEKTQANLSVSLENGIRALYGSKPKPKQKKTE